MRIFFFRHRLLHFFFPTAFFFDFCFAFVLVSSKLSKKQKSPFTSLKRVIYTPANQIQWGKIIPIKIFFSPRKSKREEVIFRKGVRHSEALSGRGVRSFSSSSQRGCTLLSDSFLSPRGVAVSMTEILLAFLSTFTLCVKWEL